MRSERTRGHLLAEKNSSVANLLKLHPDHWSKQWLSSDATRLGGARHFL